MDTLAYVEFNRPYMIIIIFWVCFKIVQQRAKSRGGESMTPEWQNGGHYWGWRLGRWEFMIQFSLLLWRFENFPAEIFLIAWITMGKEEISLVLLIQVSVDPVVHIQVPSGMTAGPLSSCWESSATSLLHGLSLLERETLLSGSPMWGQKAWPPHSTIPASAPSEIALWLLFSLWPILHLSHPLHRG